jgi:hypothetical protein
MILRDESMILKRNAVNDLAHFRSVNGQVEKSEADVGALRKELGWTHHDLHPDTQRTKSIRTCYCLPSSVFATTLFKISISYVRTEPFGLSHVVG